MNQRTRNIAAEATKWCEQNAQGAPVAWEWEEKFAELVVQDCLRTCDTVMQWATKLGQFERAAGVAELSDRIKYNFGIDND